MVRDGIVGACSDMGLHVDAVHQADGVPHGDAAQKKERVIYNMIEVLPPPRNEPVSESDSDLEDNESQSESRHSDGPGGNGYYVHDDDGTDAGCVYTVKNLNFR